LILDSTDDGRARNIQNLTGDGRTLVLDDGSQNATDDGRTRGIQSLTDDGRTFRMTGTEVPVATGDSSTTRKRKSESERGTEKLNTVLKSEGESGIEDRKSEGELGVWESECHFEVGRGIQEKEGGYHSQVGAQKL
jgi:hypothetical protein